MSRALITEDYLTDIADAIRAKNGSSDTYTPPQMAAAIAAIPTGGDVDVEALSVTANGTYTAPTGKAYSPVTVNVGGGGGDDPFALTDYIESSGTQWIDTGYLVNPTSRFELVANINSNNAQFASMFGTRVSSVPSTSALGAYLWCKYNGNSQITADFGTGQINVSDTFGSAANIYDKKTRMILQNGYVGGDVSGIDGTLGSLLNSVVTPTDQYSVYLFNLNEAGHEYGAATRCSMKLYRFRIYEGSALVHEFVPWTDDNDVVCLKDTVTGNLKYNAGTGVFVRGSGT